MAPVDAAEALGAARGCREPPRAGVARPRGRGRRHRRPMVDRRRPGAHRPAVGVPGDGPRLYPPLGVVRHVRGDSARLAACPAHLRAAGCRRVPPEEVVARPRGRGGRGGRAVVHGRRRQAHRAAVGVPGDGLGLKLPLGVVGHIDGDRSRGPPRVADLRPANRCRVPPCKVVLVSCRPRSRDGSAPLHGRQGWRNGTSVGVPANQLSTRAVLAVIVVSGSRWGVLS